MTAKIHTLTEKIKTNLKRLQENNRKTIAKRGEFMDFAAQNHALKKGAKEFVNLKKCADENKRQTIVKRLLFVVFGAIIGVVNGLFGAGGGMLAVPLLSIVGGLESKKAHATAILVILPLCLVSSVTYLVGGNVNLIVLLCASAGVFVGGILGAKLLKILPENIVVFAF